MLKKVEREALLGFLAFHGREFHRVCSDRGPSAMKITDKLRKHKTDLNGFRAKPLTLREQAVLAGFLRDKNEEFKAWCRTFEVGIDALRTALKGMVTQ